MPRLWTASQKQRAWATSLEALNGGPDAIAEKLLKRTFKKHDKDGDGLWSREELARFIAKSKCSPRAARLAQELGSLVDADGDGSLSIDEVGTLLHLLGLEHTSCGLCHEPILDDAMWVCRTCCTQHVRQKAQDWAAVCEGCYWAQPAGLSHDCADGCARELSLVRHDPFVPRALCPLYKELEKLHQQHGTNKGGSCCCGPKGFSRAPSTGAAAAPWQPQRDGGLQGLDVGASADQLCQQQHGAEKEGSCGGPHGHISTAPAAGGEAAPRQQQKSGGGPLRSAGEAQQQVQQAIAVKLVFVHSGPAGCCMM